MSFPAYWIGPDERVYYRTSEGETYIFDPRKNEWTAPAPSPERQAEAEREVAKLIARLQKRSD